MITRTVWLAAVACGICACARTASHGAPAVVSGAGPASSAAPTNESLRAAEQEWGRAIRWRDYRALERVLAPEFRLVTSSELTRADWLANLHNFKVDSLALFHIVPRVTGDSGVAWVELFWHAEVEGRAPINRTTLNEDTWRYRDGRWVVVERRVTATRPGYAPSASPPHP